MVSLHKSARPSVGKDTLVILTDKARLRELDVERANGGTSRGVLIVRRPGWPDPGEWFAVQRVRDFPF